MLTYTWVKMLSPFPVGLRLSSRQLSYLTQRLPAVKLVPASLVDQ